MPPRSRWAHFETGPSDGEAALLLHGFPYDIHSYVEVIPRLVAADVRVIVPYLRGHGPTRFLDQCSPRSGQQAANGTDVVDLLDALEIPRTILAGYDWGGRAACVAAALAALTRYQRSAWDRAAPAPLSFDEHETGSVPR